MKIVLREISSALGKSYIFKKQFKDSEYFFDAMAALRG